MRQDPGWPSIFQATIKQKAKALERKEAKRMRLVEYALAKLQELRIKAEFEDRQRGKKRYISKVSAYNDLIKLLEDLYERNDIQ